MLDVADSADGPARPASALQSPLLRRPAPPTLIRSGVIVVLLVFVLLGLPQLLSQYYVVAMTQVAVYAIVALGLGVLVSWKFLAPGGDELVAVRDGTMVALSISSTPRSW